MATAKIILDTRFESPAGGYYIKLRVTHERSSKYYPCRHKKDAADERDIEDTLELNRTFTKAEFGKITGEKPYFKDKKLIRNDDEKRYKAAFDSFLKKADVCINTIRVFSFEEFENLYLQNRGAKDNLETAFKRRIDELKREGRIGSANGLINTINSLQAFHKSKFEKKKGVQKPLTFAHITVSWLKEYEQYMISINRSKTTIGIYLRGLRVVINEAISDGRIDKSVYPFRTHKSQKGKYQIKGKRNIKKAMNGEDLEKLFYYQSDNRALQQTRDFWVLSFLLNGANLKDVLGLRWKNFDGEFLRFQRAKSEDTKDVSEDIIVHLKPEAIAIINKYSIKSLSPESLIFPVLNDKMDAETKHKKQMNFITNMNKNLKKMCRELGIERVSTIAARHSFATRLMRHGASVEFIQKSMGHTSTLTTQNYLSSFETDAIKQITDILIPQRKAQ